MPFTLPVAFFSQDSSNTINYTVTYSIAPDVGTFSSTSSLSQDGTKSISADGITFTSNNSNIVADCAKIQLDTDLDEYRIQKIEFYNRRGDLEKILIFDNYKKYLNKYWRAHNMIMENVQTGKSTSLSWGEYSFRNGLKENDISPQALEKASR